MNIAIMLKPNNILSYFIKDIKDPKERALYTQINTINIIEIFFKGKLLYKIIHNDINPGISWNYTNNIIKEYYYGRIINYKINSIKTRNYKELFYKKDMKISKVNGNYIYYSFIYNKYLIKINGYYVAEFKYLLCIKIKYFNGNKYLYKDKSKDKSNQKYIFNQILILNKYELHYINSFFSLFFVSRNYSELFGIIRNYSELFGIIRNYSELFGIIRNY